MKGPTEYEQMMKTKKRKYVANSGMNFLYFMAGFIITILTIAYTSIIMVEAEEIAVIINRSSGVYEECFSPGINIKPFVKVTHKVEHMSYTVIPNGKLGVLSRKATNLQIKILKPGQYKINLNKYTVKLEEQAPGFKYKFDENGELIYGIKNVK